MNVKVGVNRLALNTAIEEKSKEINNLGRLDTLSRYRYVRKIHGGFCSAAIIHVEGDEDTRTKKVKLLGSCNCLNMEHGRALMCTEGLCMPC